jgi:hypothetical protein
MKSPDDRHQVLARFAEGPALLERVLAGLGEGDLDTPPANGGWTIRQIVHHVVDGDDLWKTCIKASLGNERGEFTLGWYWALPQEEWADRWAYAHRSVDVSLALLKASRGHVLQLLERVPDGWCRSIGVRKSDGEIERLPVGTIVAMQTDHLEHHVNRILAMQAESSGASPTPSRT